MLRAVRWNVILLATPVWLAAAALPPALLGLLCWPGGLGRRVAVVVLGYTGAFCIVGRPDNAYWGLMIAPLWSLGLVAVAVAVTRLLGRLHPQGASSIGGLYALR